MDTFHSDFVHTGNSPWYVCHMREFDAAFNKQYKVYVCIKCRFRTFSKHTYPLTKYPLGLIWYCERMQIYPIRFNYTLLLLVESKRARTYALLLRKLEFIHKATYLCVRIFFSMFLFVIKINVGKPDGFSLINRIEIEEQRTTVTKTRLDSIIELRISRTSANIIEMNGKLFPSQIFIWSAKPCTASILLFISIISVQQLI